ncbi:MAG TPA: hypothetical protein VMI54_09930 [Polyangiaceae bacterium]|nr:hypothetical protein [Polyangiaceae bacterium]
MPVPDRRLAAARRRAPGHVALLLGCAVLAGCGGNATRAASAVDGGVADEVPLEDWSTDAGAPPQSYALRVTDVSTRFETEDHFIASVEMQLSGEPFAEAMGRDLGGYQRNYVCQESVCSPSMYFDPALPPDDAGAPVGRVDLAGFAAAVESYEYSKQPMNNVAFESGAGTSLLFGPVLNPERRTGADALALAHDWVLHMIGGSNAGAFIPSDPTGAPLGWPGLWLTLEPFTGWDPAISPTNAGGCSLSSDDTHAFTCEEYECDYTSLNLPNRESQVDKTIGPGASGWVDWKDALWTLNYLQVMHDPREVPEPLVAPTQLASVGVPGNAVTAGVHAGIYLGSSDVEGLQAGNFIQILDNQAEQWLRELTTADGNTLDGFASLSEALAYSETSPLRWFPAAIGVTEVEDASGFPRPDAYVITTSDSRLLDLAGLLGAYASAYSLTDQANGVVGGSQPVLAYFDGDPFPVQNQIPDGEATLHDRALALMRVLVVDMERLHRDPASGLLVDSATFAHGTPAAGTVLSTDVAAYALLGLRTARRALDSELTLYGNTTPDAALVPTPLDSFPMADTTTFGEHLDALIASLSSALYDRLTTPDGVAFAGIDVRSLQPTDDGSSLDAHSAAIRGLLLAYLASGAPRFRDRAELVFARLERSFYDSDARLYRPTAGDRSAEVTFTPRRFGLLQGALRDTYELVAVLPRNAGMPALIEDRVGRLDKLVLNGWDDANEDGLVDWPDECARVGTGPDGQPLGLGGLQMAERALSGESGSVEDSTFGGAPRTITTDREHDCVPDISAVGLPSALASSITFTLTPRSPTGAGGTAP